MLQRLLALDDFKELQVVATTHSPYILDELNPSDVHAFALRDDGTVATRPLSEHRKANRRRARCRQVSSGAWAPSAIGSLRIRRREVPYVLRSPGRLRTASALVERVIRELAPEWVADRLDHAPLEWIADDAGTQGAHFFKLHRLDAYRKQLKHLRFRYGHFDGKPGSADAQMGRNAFTIAEALRKQSQVDAVFVVRDMDDQGEQRRQGLAQAREEALRWAAFRIVLGCADRMREAWVLAGFEPESDEEKKRLDEEHQALGFWPHEQAHQLDAKHDQANRSPKRVVCVLTAGSAEREERCWVDAPLELLRARGPASGLCGFLDQVETHVVPLFSQRP